MIPSIGFGAFFIVAILFFIYFLLKSVYMVKQAEAIVIEKLGKYSRVLTPGLHIVIPFLEAQGEYIGHMYRKLRENVIIVTPALLHD